MVYATSEPDRTLLTAKCEALMGVLASVEEEDVEASAEAGEELQDIPLVDSVGEAWGVGGGLEGLFARVAEHAGDTPHRVGYVPISYLERDPATGPELLRGLVAALGTDVDSASVSSPASPQRGGAATADGIQLAALRTGEFMDMFKQPGRGPAGQQYTAFLSHATGDVVLAGKYDVTHMGKDGRVLWRRPTALLTSAGRGGEQPPTTPKSTTSARGESIVLSLSPAPRRQGPGGAHVPSSAPSPPASSGLRIVRSKVVAVPKHASGSAGVGAGLT